MKRIITTAAVGTILALTLVACGETKQAENRAERQPVARTAPDDVTPPTDPPITTPPTMAKRGAKLVIADQGFTINKPDSIGTVWGDVGIKLKNEGDETANFVKVVVSWLDARGLAVKTETEYGDSIPAGKTAVVAVKTMDLPSGVKKIKADAFFNDSNFLESQTTWLTVTAANNGGKDEYGDDIRVTGRVKNPTAKIAEGGEIDCFTRDSVGKITGGTSTYLDTMGPGAEVAFEASVRHNFASLGCTAAA